MVTICVLEPPTFRKVGRRRRSRTFVARAKILCTTVVLPFYGGRTLSPPRAFPLNTEKLMTYRAHLTADFQSKGCVSLHACHSCRAMVLIIYRNSHFQRPEVKTIHHLPKGANAGEPPSALLLSIPKTGHRVLPALSAPNPCTKIGTPENIPAIRGLVSVKEKLFILYRDLHPPESFCSVYRIGTRRGGQTNPDFHEPQKHTGDLHPALSLQGY